MPSPKDRWTVPAGFSRLLRHSARKQRVYSYNSGARMGLAYRLKIKNKAFNQRHREEPEEWRCQWSVHPSAVESTGDACDMILDVDCIQEVQE